MKQSGMTLVEILIAITIAGLLAILTIPKVLTPQSDIRSSAATKVEQMMEQLAIATKTYETTNGKTVNLAEWTAPRHPYEKIFMDYGNYFAFKQWHATTGGTDPDTKYFMLPDSSRLTARPELFSFGGAYGPAEYANGAAGILPKDQWKAPNAASGAEGYCGIYDSRTCIYFDVNGKSPPNRIGATGDIVPLRIDPDTGRIKTLYQWEKLEDLTGTDPATVAKLCKFVSFYDVYAYNANCP